MADSDDFVISFNQVNKFFYFQHQKTLKELVQALYSKEKTLERVHALRDLSFSIKKGEAVGIIGKNGAGKSTLLKLIAKVSEPTTGSVTVNGRVTPLLELGAGFHPDLTGRENILLNGVILGLKENYIKKIFSDIVKFSEIEEFIDIPIKHYSSGMYMRLAFSVAVFTNPQILLIDEILAVGDVTFQEKCLKKMEEFKKRKVTIIFVSHDMETVKNFCNRIIYLESGRKVYDGEPAEAVKMYTPSKHKINIKYPYVKTLGTH